MNRRATASRTTRETSVEITLDLDGTGDASVETGVGMFDHLLASLAHHSMIDLVVRTEGDLHIDEHHTVEDTALVLGSAIDKALGDRSGITRFANSSVPMDEAIASCVVDAGGRPYAVLDLAFHGDRIGTLGTQMIPHALESLIRTSSSTVHLRARGKNDHHIAEAALKAYGIALRGAISLDPRRQGVPSTKGTL
jgi:imidazoleglycerol-phosphate dehydratase